MLAMSWQNLCHGESAHTTADDMQRINHSEFGTREAVPARVHVGRFARRALKAGRGSVLAAFESALYLEGAACIACLVPPSAPRGPLNVIVDGFSPGTPELRGAAWRTDGATLAVDGLGTFAISPRGEWAPVRLPARSPNVLRAGIASMRAALAARVPRGELLVHALGCLPEHRAVQIRLTVSRPTAVDAHFARTVPALSRWLDDALAERGRSSPHPVADLLGAGHGLTPSGDDCIVGVLVGLHALGERRVAASVARAVARYAPHRTTRLSAAHLEAACGGEAIEPVHAAIEAVAGTTSPEPALDALERYGHGSGFDALAGVLLAAAVIAHNRVSAQHPRPSRSGGTGGTRTPARLQ